MIRVQHLLPSLAESAAGLATAVHGLELAQRQAGMDATALGADQVAAIGRASALARSCQGADVVHSHGLWLAPSRASRRLRRSGVPTVVAPHGMLDPWAWQRRRALKQLLWWAGEQRSLERASCLQALCTAERDAIRALGITAPIALIPNGVALPQITGAARAALPPAPWRAQGVPAAAPVLLFLGRFHSKKGISPLLSAWARLQEQAPCGDQPWLVLAGFGDGGALADQLQRSPIPQVCVLGPLHGAAKASALAHARGFVLPSFSEGLPMAALEAMSWELPCLLSKACNLPEAFDAGGSWQAPPDPEALLPVLLRWSAAALSGSAELAAMGQVGRQLVAERFSWPSVAFKTLSLYQWLLGSAPSPDCLRL